MGESTLQHWAAEVDITANRVVRDRTGWDYVLEFPAIASAHGPIDLVPPPVVCFIQVKATARRRLTSVPVKLTNWKRLVEKPFPAFFLIVEYRREKVTAAHLVHVDAVHISAVVEKLRSLPDEVPTALNSVCLPLKWDHSHELAQLNGEGLRSGILQQIPDGMDVYFKWKSAQFSSCGFSPNGHHRLHIQSQFAPGTTLEQIWNELVEFAIGATDALPVSDALLEREVRFGIPIDKVRVDGNRLLLRNRPVAQEADLSFFSKSGAGRSNLHVQVYNPNFLLPSVPTPFLKARLTFPGGSIVVHPATQRFDFKLDLDNSTTCPLCQLAATWSLVLLLSRQDQDPLFVEFPGAPLPPAALPVVAAR